MKTMKQWLCMLLSILMLLTVGVSCADDADNEGGEAPSEETDESEQPDADVDPEAESDLLLTLPEYNFSGEEYIILCRTDKEYEIDIDYAPSGDLINDAIFARNARVEELYDVEIASMPVNGTWNEQNTFTSTVLNAVASGSEDFTLVAGYLAYISNLAMQDCFYNLHEVETLDLTQKWWAESFVENMTLFDCLFFADGDISLTMWESLYALYFNKQIAQDRGIDYLYQMVTDGEWTLEEMKEITIDLYEDNGNDKVDMEDTFGMITNCHSMRAMVTTCGIPLTERNDEGTYDIVFFDEVTVDLFDELYEFVHSNDAIYMMVLQNDEDYTDILRMFANGQAFFISGTLDQSATLRNMETSFGILPFPKYDEYQETYLSHSYDGHSIFSIPSSLTDPSMAGAVLDALAAESRQAVVPQYYEVVLQGRTTRDEESVDMLDIIRENLYFDFGFVHSLSLGSIYSTFGDLIENSNNTFVSGYVSKAASYESKLEELLATYESVIY